MYKKEEPKTASKDVDAITSPFVKMELDGKDDMYIRKRTAVWLFQDSERLSSDRLFRVRAKQPFAAEKLLKQKMLESNKPQIAAHVLVGDLCIFKTFNDKMRIGRVLQFVKYDKSKELPYRGNYAETNNKQGVLCTWYESISSNNTLTQFTILSVSNTTYCSLDTYMCTLTNNCLVNNPVVVGIASNLFQPQIISTSDRYTLTEECAEFLTERLAAMVNASNLPKSLISKKRK